MTTTELVEQITDDGVTTLRLNRAASMNALDVALKEALLSRLQAVAGDSAVRCVVLTGSGRAFCVGQDLNEHMSGLRSGSADLADTVEKHYNPIAELLATMDKPVIAAVNGIAAGAGAAFAMACDLRILAESAGMNLAFAGIGLSCDSGTSYWLPRLVGPARAKELLFFPRTIPSQECLTLGLATQVVPDADFDAAVRELARRLATGPTLAYGAIRRSLAHATGSGLGPALAFEAELMRRTGATQDHRAAVDAFLNKEPATFTGR